VNGSDEVRAGAVGLLAAVLFWGLISLMVYVLYAFKVHAAEDIAEVGLSMAPGGIVAFDLGMPSTGRAERTPSWNWFLAGMMIISHAALAATYVSRFGRLAAGRRQRVEHVMVRELPTWLAPPRRSPFAAIAWKQFRESAPLAVLGATCIALITLIVYLSTKREGITANQLPFMAATVWMIVGVMVAVVAGVGVFLDDLSPGLNGFWRSRPIKLGQWFVVKYVVGLLVTIVTIAVPLVAAGLYVWLAPDDLSVSNLSNDADVRYFALLGGVGQVVVYNCAIAAIVLLRRPIHAAFTAIAVALLTWVSSALISEIFFRSAMSHGIVVATLVGCSMLAMLAVAWLAMKNDWGWRR
jgi:hypothetical protein